MKNLKSAYKRTTQRRRGTILYIVAGSLVMIMGAAALAVDFGVLNADANRLQRGCDAGALAGATKLKSTGDDAVDVPKAKDLAVLTAKRNDVVVNINDIVVFDNNRRIRVPATYVRPLFFARIFNMASSTLTRSATARKKGLATPQIAPIGISSSLLAQMKTDFTANGGTNSYDQRLVNHKKNSFDSSKFMLFDLRQQPSKSPSHMADQLTGAEVVPIDLGDNAGDGIFTGEDGTTLTETVLNAGENAQYAKYAEAMTTIFQRAAASPWFDTPVVAGNIGAAVGAHYLPILAGAEPADNPRLMSIIVTPDSPAVSGTYEAPVVNLARVYIERVYSDGQGYHTVFRYVPGNAGDSGGAFLIE